MAAKNIMNHRDEKPFWRTKSLSEMNKDEWESLCDGCGKCCLQQLDDETTGTLVFTDVACELFDAQTCRCTDYQNRSSRVPTCMTLNISNVLKTAEFAPSSCSYRLLALGENLPVWHPLRHGGDRGPMDQQGYSAKNRCRSMKSVDLDNLEEFLVDWPNKA